MTSFSAVILEKLSGEWLLEQLFILDLLLRLFGPQKKGDPSSELSLQTASSLIRLLMIGRTFVILLRLLL